MNRRRFLLASAGAAAGPLLSSCSLINQVAPVPTTVSVNMSQLYQVIEAQQCSEWCWAASTSMVFAFHGYFLTQAQIVAATFGAVACIPAYTDGVIGGVLSRNYVDDNGKPFSARVTAAFDAQNGIYSLNNATLVNELANNRPLIYCNTTHCEVIYSVTYTGSAANPQVLEVDVVDPWPPNPRVHTLSEAEMIPAPLGGAMMFVAAVSVT